MLKNNIAIRRANTKDIERLVAFQQQIASYHSRFDKIYNPGKKISKTAIKKHMLSLLRKREARVFALLHKDDIVGFATVHIKKMSPVFSETKMGHIGTVYVEKPYREMGLGKLAISESIAWFRKNRISEVDLSVDAKNKTGVKAWRKIGFYKWRYSMRMKISS